LKTLLIEYEQDPDAPICQIADYTLTADLFEAAPELTKKLSASA